MNAEELLHAESALCNLVDYFDFKGRDRVGEIVQRLINLVRAERLLQELINAKPD